VMIANGASLDQYVCQANIYILEASERSEASDIAKPNKGASLMNFKICWICMLSENPHVAVNSIIRPGRLQNFRPLRVAAKPTDLTRLKGRND
jgi:hypothetical protein